MHFEIIDSTNSYARRSAADLPLPCLITADAQTSGRGRQGRSFFSPKSTGLYMTLVFSPDRPLGLITPAAAVAVCETLEDFGVENLGIKWVNDIFLDGKKVCGILCEHFLEGGKEYISVGIGINLTTDEFPEQLTAAGSINLDLPKDVLSDAIAEKLLKYANNPNDSFICTEYEKRLFFLGGDISFVQNGIPFTAVALGINNDCNLKVRLPDSSVKVLSSGEISIKI